MKRTLIIRLTPYIYIVCIYMYVYIYIFIYIHTYIYIYIYIFIYTYHWLMFSMKTITKKDCNSNIIPMTRYNIIRAYCEILSFAQISYVQSTSLLCIVTDR